MSKGDRCGEVQWLESRGSEKSHDVTFGTQCLRQPKEQGCHYVRGTATLRAIGDKPDLQGGSSSCGCKLGNSLK
jgi:hypothetical protein